MRTRRVPAGYLGIEHETIGMSILALLTVSKLRVPSLELVTLPALDSIDPAAWYPIGILLELMDRLEEQVGHFGLVRMGRKVFEMSHASSVSKHSHSARDVLYAFDGMYRRVNRGRGIGGWRVLRFEPGDAEVEKTTPHHCAMEQGIITAALVAVGCPSIVSQSRCIREGAETCRFVVSSALTDARWDGRKPGVT